MLTFKNWCPELIRTRAAFSQLPKPAIHRKRSAPSRNRAVIRWMPIARGENRQCTPLERSDVAVDLLRHGEVAARQKVELHVDDQQSTGAVQIDVVKRDHAGDYRLD